MKNALHLIFVVTLTYQSPVTAAVWSDWLVAYECSTPSQTRPCNDCSPMFSEREVIRIRFSIDKSAQRVFRQTRAGKNVFPPDQLENCAVVDNENWSCTQKSSVPPLIIHHQQGMAAGLFSTFATAFPQAESIGFVGCAK